MHTMKYRAYFVLLFSFILALPFISNGQVRDKKKTIELLCHKWASDFTKNPQKMDCFPPDADSTIRFLTNGYIIFTEKKGAEGVWNYDAVRNNLYIIVNGSLWKYNINSLTAAELVVESAAGKNTRMWNLLKSGQ
ncbi:MAG: hypothetical protein ABIQ88_14735 [Chitinophagaceae bacterium]